MNKPEPKIKTLETQKLVGKRMKMSITLDKTEELWRSFMPHRNSIPNRASDDFISMQVYPTSYFNGFSPAKEFEKWAAVAVSDIVQIPEGMEVFDLEGGQYAVFHHKGISSDGSIFQYIFGEWLPQSEYNLDDRPHFEILGQNYIQQRPGIRRRDLDSN